MELVLKVRAQHLRGESLFASLEALTIYRLSICSFRVYGY